MVLTRAKALDKISFETPKVMKVVYKAAAEAFGMSLMGLARTAIEEFILNHTGEDFANKELIANQKLLSERFGKLPPETQKIVLGLVCNAEKLSNKGQAEVAVPKARELADKPINFTVRKEVAETRELRLTAMIQAAVKEKLSELAVEEKLSELPPEEELSEQEQLLLARFNRLPQKTKDTVLNLVGEAARVANKGAD